LGRVSTPSDVLGQNAHTIDRMDLLSLARIVTY